MCIGMYSCKQYCFYIHKHIPTEDVLGLSYIYLSLGGMKINIIFTDSEHTHTRTHKNVHNPTTGSINHRHGSGKQIKLRLNHSNSWPKRIHNPCEVLEWLNGRVYDENLISPTTQNRVTATYWWCIMKEKP